MGSYLKENTLSYLKEKTLSPGNIILFLLLIAFYFSGVIIDLVCFLFTDVVIALVRFLFAVAVSAYCEIIEIINTPLSSLTISQICVLVSFVIFGFFALFLIVDIFKTFFPDDDSNCYYP